MKAKANHSALSGIVSIGHTDMAGVVSFAGGDTLLRQADQMYLEGRDQDARQAVREALKIALQRLDAVHGSTVELEDEYHIPNPAKA
ncbi:MAG: hypothetical protein FIA89_12760 [Geobacter sp.]|jgi:hypothetical protein|nr:hypothetical protein [Geobacter sp.]